MRVRGYPGCLVESIRLSESGRVETEIVKMRMTEWKVSVRVSASRASSCTLFEAQRWDIIERLVLVFGCIYSRTRHGGLEQLHDAADALMRPYSARQ